MVEAAKRSVQFKDRNKDDSEKINEPLFTYDEDIYDDKK